MPTPPSRDRTQVRHGADLDATLDAQRDVHETLVTAEDVPAQKPAPPMSQIRTQVAEESKPVGPGDDTLVGDEGYFAEPGELRHARGTAIGRYVVLDRIGEGGMGVVYAAYDPELDRKVAIKLLQTMPGAHSQATGGRARLLREAQAMARLTHPNVIAVYDVGSVGDAVFVAMEFVDGSTLGRWLENNAASDGSDWRRVLDVFIAAGRGLGAAHAAGIVHRDFKPENVMVGTDTRVRVLDFGLARPAGTPGEAKKALVETGPTEASRNNLEARLTATGAVMGTPAYMAPEQHAGEPADDRTDQFSFCVALYEALYGERPFAGGTIPELARNLFDEQVREPPRGTRVPAWLRNVVCRGLALDRDARHPDMRTLLEALARDPSRRRRRIALGVGVCVVAGAGFWAVAQLTPDADLCKGAEETLQGVWDDDVKGDIQAAFATDQKAFAERAWSTVQTELDAYARGWVEMRTEACEATRLRGEQSDEILSLRMRCLDRRLHRLQGLTAILAETDLQGVARAPQAVDALPDLAPCADVESLLRGVRPADDPRTRERVVRLQADVERGRAMSSMGQLEESLSLGESVLEEARQTGYQPVIAEALDLIGGLSVQMANYDRAGEALEEALYLAEAAGYDTEIVSVSIGLMMLEGSVHNRYDVARIHARRAEAIIERMGGSPALRERLLSHRGQVESTENRHEEAEASFREALRIRREQAWDQEPSTLIVLNGLATQLTELDRLDEAGAHLDEAIEIGREQLGPLHPDVGITLAALGRLQASRGRPEEALEPLREALSIFEQALGKEHPNCAAIHNGLGLALGELERNAEAIEHFEQALAIAEKSRGAQSLNVAHVLNNLGLEANAAGDHERALELQQRSMEIKRDKLGPDNEDIGYAYDNIASALRGLGRHEEAIENNTKALAIFEKNFGPDDYRCAYALRGIAESHLALGQRGPGLTALQRAVEIYEHDASAEADETAKTWFLLAQHRQGDPEGARALAARAALAYLARPEKDAEPLAEIVRWLEAEPP